MDWQSIIAIAAGLAVTAVYFYLFNLTFSVSRRVPLGVAQVLLIFGYIGRLAVVFGLLAAAAFLGGLDQLILAVSFMVSYTTVFIYTQGRAVRELMTGRLSERKE